MALRLTGRPCLVVGGGAVAARKVRSLLEAGAAVTVVSPELGADLATARPEGLWSWRPRAFKAEDVDGCLLAVAATDDPSVNLTVASAAARVGALCNVVDDPRASDFFVPSVIQRGHLQLTVATGGLAPAVSAAIRRRLDMEFPVEWGEAVAILGRAREEASARGLSADARRELARELADLDIDMILTGGGIPSFTEAVAACISRFSA